MILSVAKEFSSVPGPRSRDEGPFSAEQFLDELLHPKFDLAESAGETLLVDLDGGCGYATSFLEEAFGGLARKLSSSERVLNILRIKSDEEPYLQDDVTKYVREAMTGAQVAQ